MKRNKITLTVTVIVAVAVIVCSIFIASKGLGLVEGYDFGIGAYYYADIPGFEKIINDDAYDTSVPLWVHIALFLGWGYIIWKLWVWIEKK
jgi:hypothetical protein